MSAFAVSGFGQAWFRHAARGARRPRPAELLGAHRRGRVERLRRADARWLFQPKLAGHPADQRQRRQGADADPPLPERADAPVALARSERLVAAREAELDLLDRGAQPLEAVSQLRLQRL
jgi:hypothetical protein